MVTRPRELTKGYCDLQTVETLSCQKCMVQSHMLFSDIPLKYLSQNFKAMTEIFSRRSLLWIIYGNAFLPINAR